MKLVQCIPNFSEGRRQEVVSSIVEAIESAGSAKVIDYSLDADHNRSVVTIVGDIAAIKSAVLAGASKAVELIDIRKHKGEHPRIGAIDVIPVVPLLGCTMAECIALSYEIGRELADTLGIPVYFYERSANMGHRVNLTAIRKGGFEALHAESLSGQLNPDLGPKKVHPTAGATVVGARGPLIAYNVNLKTSDMTIARKIARKIRKVRDTGKDLAGVKAIGVNLRSRGLVQVSTNITQPHAATIFDVYTFIENEARKSGVEIAESELIGAVRQEAIVDALCNAIKLPHIQESRVLDNWLPGKTHQV